LTPLTGASPRRSVIIHSVTPFERQKHRGSYLRLPKAWTAVELRATMAATSHIVAGGATISVQACCTNILTVLRLRHSSRTINASYIGLQGFLSFNLHINLQVVAGRVFSFSFPLPFILPSPSFLCSIMTNTYDRLINEFLCCISEGTPRRTQVELVSHLCFVLSATFILQTLSSSPSSEMETAIVTYCL